MCKTTDGTKDNKRVMVQTIWGAPSAKVILFKINVEKHRNSKTWMILNFRIIEIDIITKQQQKYWKLW